jgi:hypothetical protein
LFLRTALETNPVRPSPVIPFVERPTEAPIPSVIPSAVPTDPKHFIKLPNPETLSDGISPIFENWENKVLNKLECNSWLFPNERTRFAWLTSLVSDDARFTLAPYINRKNPRAFTITQEVFDLFRQLYNNPNQQGAAKNALTIFWMRIINKFFAFCAKFVKLASLAKVPLSEWKYELNRKLITTFRQAVLVYYLNEFRDFEGFRKACFTAH